MELKGKVVVITGGAHGIGAALARAAKARGAGGIAICDLEAQAAQQVADEVGGIAYGLDVRDEGAIAAMIDDVETRLGPVDLYISNAGVGFTDAPDWTAAGTSNENWQTAWEVNQMAHVYAARKLLPGWKARGEGYFLITASAAGLLSQIGDAAYSTTKHANIGYAESMAITHGDDGIKVSVLCPQGVRTRMLDHIDDRSVGADGIMSAKDVAEVTLDGVAAEEFLITPHATVRTYMQHKVSDYGRWLGGMRKFRRFLMADKDTPI